MLDDDVRAIFDLFLKSLNYSVLIFYVSTVLISNKNIVMQFFDITYNHSFIRIQLDLLIKCLCIYLKII